MLPLSPEPFPGHVACRHPRGLFFFFRALVHFAAFSGNVQIFELLDELSLNFAVKGVNDLTPFHIAAKYGHLGLCKWLYVRGCSTSDPSRDGHSPVHLAILNYHFDVADFLLRTGADVREANEHMVGGKTLLHRGIENLPRGIEIVAFLLARGARQLPDARGTMPIHDACCRRNIELISMLVDHDAAINSLDRKLMTPLHYAVRHNSMQVCVFLLENDSDLGAVDRRGRTPLHHAAALGFLPLVELLCDYGADVLAIDWDEKTPMNLAYSHNRRQVVTYFASLGVENRDEYEEEEELDKRAQPRMSIRGEFPERKIYARS